MHQTNNTIPISITVPGSLFGSIGMEDGLSRDVIRHFFVHAHVQIITRFVRKENADGLTLPVGAARGRNDGDEREDTRTKKGWYRSKLHFFLVAD